MARAGRRRPSGFWTALVVAAAVGVAVAFGVWWAAYRVYPPRCRQYFGPGPHIAVCYVDLWPYVLVPAVAGLVAGALTAALILRRR